MSIIINLKEEDYQVEFKTLKKTAIFIDYENANALDSYNPLFLKLNSLGYNSCIRKLISSTIPKAKNFEEVVKENEFEFVLSNKKVIKGNKKKNFNNADFRMYVEVLKDLYTLDIETFIIYASDEGYTDLICEIKRNGKEVIGVGDKNKVKENYISLFHNFIFIDDFTSKTQIKDDDINIKEKRKVKVTKKKIIPQEKNNIIDSQESNISNEKNDIFYSILKDATINVLQDAKTNGNKGPFLIANIVSKLKEDSIYLKDFKKITLKDFTKCGFKVKKIDGQNVKSYIDLDSAVL